MGAPIDRARAAFAERSWDEAFIAYAAAARDRRLQADDCERFAVAAYLVGEDDACEQGWEAAHRAALDAGDPAGAARCACWLALALLLRGQMAKANGWLARADRLINDAGDCPAAGYRLVPAVLGALGAGDPATACDVAVRATEIADRFDDVDLRALAVLGHGQALLAVGDTVTGTARLDEVMVSVAAGEVGPVAMGIVYCAVIIECMSLFDVSRASEWTAALGSWCDEQPSLVPYRGQCLVHRSQLQQAVGDWVAAMTSVESACRHLSDPPHPALGLAHYQRAELHRLVGAFDEADAAYRLASRCGHHPMPGVALLELARGDLGAAARTIRQAIDEARDWRERPPLLAAAVEILREAGDLAGAKTAVDELAKAAELSASQLLEAMAAYALGAVLLADGDPAAAILPLRDGASGFRSLHMPYEAARTGVLAGLARAAVGDRITAAIELENARTSFAALGARPDLARVEALLGEPASGVALSERERQVLSHLVAGSTNREIAASLVISQHTVRRHVENIFAKLGVTTRAAATAYAYEHGLVARR